MRGKRASNIPRDAEVLRLCAEGKSFREIARRLGISHQVVYGIHARSRVIGEPLIHPTARAWFTGKTDASI